MAPRHRAVLVAAALYDRPARNRARRAAGGARRDRPGRDARLSPARARSAQGEIHGREILLRFGEKLPDEIEGELQAALGRWIDSISTGYDSILLHAAIRSSSAASGRARLRPGRFARRPTWPVPARAIPRPRRAGAGARQGACPG